MKHYYPDFYKKFKCIADKCPDSCCKDWDVVVDDESQAFYSTVNGDFGNKLKSVTAVDSDGDRIFVLNNGICPFWNNQKLCDIYINLGGDHLCATCRSFPRISQDYTVFCEHMLSFACPEAARLMLDSDMDFDFETHVSPDTNPGYDVKIMNFLLQARKITFEIFCDTSLSFSNKLKSALAFNAKIQYMLDEENYNTDKLPKPETNFISSNQKDCSFIFDLHKSLDTMSKEWRTALDKLANTSVNSTFIQSIDSSFDALAKYYVLRYYLTAIDSFDVLVTLKRLVCAYKVCSHMLSASGNLSFEECAAVMQRYSKEVEHSYENSERLEDEFCFSPDFSTENLLKII